MIESLRLWLEELLQEMDDVGGRLTELDVASVYKYFPTHSITHCKIQVVKRPKRACNIIILNECMMGCFNYFAFFTFLSCFLITLFVDHENEQHLHTKGLLRIIPYLFFFQMAITKTSAQLWLDHVFDDEIELTLYIESL